MSGERFADYSSITTFESALLLHITVDRKMGENSIGLGQLPIPEEKEIGHRRFVTTWQVTMEDMPPRVQLLSQVHSLEKQLSVQIEAVGGNDLIITSIRGAGTTYSDGYLAVWFALQRLEEVAGRIAFIEGLPREKWTEQFSMIAHVTLVRSTQS